MSYKVHLKPQHTGIQPELFIPSSKYLKPLYHAVSEHQDRDGENVDRYTAVVDARLRLESFNDFPQRSIHKPDQHAVLIYKIRPKPPGIQSGFSCFSGPPTLTFMAHKRMNLTMLL